MGPNQKGLPATSVVARLRVEAVRPPLDPCRRHLVLPRSPVLPSTHLPTTFLLAGQGQDVEESGWKMVSGDVFRAPSSPLSLCVQVGSGVQIVASGFITLFFAALVSTG